MSVTCPQCAAITRGVTLHDADGERVFACCDVCGFASVEHIFSARRVTGASEFAAASRGDGDWRDVSGRDVAPFSCG